MSKFIRVRDVARNVTHEVAPDEAILRVPYDLFQPAGAVHRRGELVEWHQGSITRSGRGVPGLLGTVEAGERVLLRIDPGVSDEWWLCEVESVSGVSGNISR
jgi:hypothetical protein